MWSDGLEAWYARSGRHDLPWRLTRDPWAVLVSEVMLQQTSVARVLPRWRRFLERWPTPAACASATLEDVLREWAGLGYPRRARALWALAAAVAAEGWPSDEEALRRLPGIGPYTARALRAFSSLDADGTATAPPRDVNLGRVAARAALGAEPAAVTPATLDTALASGRPPGMSMRDFAFALFDVGALLCCARRADCDACPLTGCRSRDRLSAAHGRPPAATARRQPGYAGSLRQLRGEILRALLSEAPPFTVEELAERVAEVPAAGRPGALAQALAGLADDGLISARWRPVAEAAP